MRRKDKEINDANELESIIKAAKVCRIALADDNTPYLVPVNYGYEDNCLYFHSALEGRKIQMLRKNNLVCFEIEADVEVVPADSPCKWTTKYRSVIGYGRASVIDSTEEKSTALSIILAHYGAHETDYPPQHLSKVAAVRVEIESMTGKKSGY